MNFHFLSIIYTEFLLSQKQKKATFTITMHNSIKSHLATIASEEKVEVLRRFFKTGKGEYAEGDQFIGVTVPQNRSVAITHAPYSDFSTISNLLDSPVHEHRLCGLLILVEQFLKAQKNPKQIKEIVDFYIANTHKANNWDLVDLSAPKILGKWLLENPMPDLLDRMSLSENMWTQRVAIVATLTLIRANRFDECLHLAKRYLAHTHPLIHKATGWMLREVGKKSEPTLLHFLDTHIHKMPRTTLRYAIERLSPTLRTHYMSL